MLRQRMAVTGACERVCSEILSRKKKSGDPAAAAAADEKNETKDDDNESFEPYRVGELDEEVPRWILQALVEQYRREQRIIGGIIEEAKK